MRGVVSGFGGGPAAAVSGGVCVASDCMVVKWMLRRCGRVVRSVLQLVRRSLLCLCCGGCSSMDSEKGRCKMRGSCDPKGYPAILRSSFHSKRY